MADPPTDPNQLGPTFISYRQSDGLDLAIALAWSLRVAGVPVWHDQTDLPPGDTSRRLAEALDGGLSGAVAPEKGGHLIGEGKIYSGLSGCMKSLPLAQ